MKHTIFLGMSIFALSACAMEELPKADQFELKKKQWIERIKTQGSLEDRNRAGLFLVGGVFDKSLLKFHIQFDYRKWQEAEQKPAEEDTSSKEHKDAFLKSCEALDALQDAAKKADARALKASIQAIEAARKKYDWMNDYEVKRVRKTLFNDDFVVANIQEAIDGATVDKLEGLFVTLARESYFPEILEHFKERFAKHYGKLAGWGIANSSPEYLCHLEIFRQHGVPLNPELALNSAIKHRDFTLVQYLLSSYKITKEIKKKCFAKAINMAYSFSQQTSECAHRSDQIMCQIASHLPTQERAEVIVPLTRNLQLLQDYLVTEEKSVQQRVEKQALHAQEFHKDLVKRFLSE